MDEHDPTVDHPGEFPRNKAGGEPPETLDVSLESTGKRPQQPAARGRSAAAPLGVFGDYELLEEIARGGMGVVYKARQTRLNRIVALKMILSGEFAGEQEVRRFHVEAEATANLDHPGIVPIYEVGEHGGRHFFSMGFVDGSTLAARIKNGPLDAREAASLLADIAEAIAYAHQHGVVHRDLKPGNVLLDAQGRPRVMDFGLAKRTDADSNLTGTGQVLGTPSYMAPEQAAGRIDEIGPASDIYALGAVLYCLVTGRPPFQAASLTDTLLQVLQEEPLPPRRLNPGVAHDVETICLKCLQKEGRRRYASAGELGDDLQRFLDGAPIHARPIGRLERAVKWSRRRPLVAALSAVVAAALLVLLIGGAWYQARLSSALVETERERDNVREAQAETTQLLYESLVSEADYLTRMRPAGYGARVWDLLDQARKLETPAVGAPRLRQLAVSSLGHVSSQAPVLFDDLGSHVLAADVTPDGRFLFAGLADGPLAVLDLERQREVQRFDTLEEPIVRICVVATDRVLTQSKLCGEVIVWQRGEDDSWVLAERVVPSDPAGDATAADTFFDVALTPDGTRVIGFFPVAEKDVTDVEVQLAGGLISRLKTAPGTAAEASFAVRPLAAGDQVGKITLLPGVNLAFKDFALCDSHLVVGYDGSSSKLPLSATPKAASAGRGTFEDLLVICDLRTGQVERQLWTECGNLFQVAVSRDGQYVACSGTQNFQVFRRATGERLLEVHELGFCDVDSFVGGEGDLLISNVQEWIWYSLNKRRPIARLPKEPATRQFSFSSAGEHLLRSGQSDLQVTDVTPPERREIKAHATYAHCVRFSPDGRLLATGGRDEQLRIWDAESLTLVAALPGSWVDFSPDGQLLAVVGPDGLRLWRAADGTPASPAYPLVNQYATLKIEFGPQGNLLAWARTIDGMLVWRLRRAEAETNGAAWQFENEFIDPEGFFDLAWSPSGRTLAYRSNDQTQIRDLQTGQSRSIDAPPRVNGMAYLDENRLLIGAGKMESEHDASLSKIEVWDASAGKRLQQKRFHPAFPLAIAPGGRHVAFRNRLLDAESLGELFALPHWNMLAIDSDWSPDGRRLALAFDNGNVVVWDLEEVHRRLATLDLAWDAPGFRDLPPLEPIAKLRAMRGYDANNDAVEQWIRRYAALTKWAAGDDPAPESLEDDIDWLVQHVPRKAPRPFRAPLLPDWDRLRLLAKLALGCSRRGEHDARERLLLGGIRFGESLPRDDLETLRALADLKHRLADYYNFQADKIERALAAYRDEQALVEQAREAGAAIPTSTSYWMHHNYALALAKSGDREAAAPQMDKALRVLEDDPKSTAPNGLSRSYQLLIKWLKAADETKAAAAVEARGIKAGVLEKSDDGE